MEKKNLIILGLVGGLIVGGAAGYLLKLNVTLFAAIGMGLGFLAVERKVRGEV